jgi:hypothetical protein
MPFEFLLKRFPALEQLFLRFELLRSQDILPLSLGLSDDLVALLVRRS